MSLVIMYYFSNFFVQKTMLPIKIPLKLSSVCRSLNMKCKRLFLFCLKSTKKNQLSINVFLFTGKSTQ